MDVGPDDLPQLRHRAFRRGKTAMAVAQQIVGEITDNAYPPGTKLAPEKKMLLQYDVGRGTLRESLRVLEMNGAITVKPGPGGGPIVATPDAQDLASTLGLFLELHGATFGSILELRQVLEPAIAGIAAGSKNVPVLEAITASAESMAGNIDDLDHFLMENERFHGLIAVAAGNPIFTLLIGSLECITDGRRAGITFPVERRLHIAEAHREIAAALVAGDAERSRLAMDRHVAAFQRYVRRFHPEAADRRLRWRDIAP